MDKKELRYDPIRAKILSFLTYVENNQNCVYWYLTNTEQHDSWKKKRQTQESKKIGRAGEDYVYKFEYNKLIKANKKDLANKIDKHYEKYEYPGWDITSFDTNGEKIFIEVKSTKGEVINDLDITDNEWEAAQKERTNYYVYLVNKVLTEN